MMIVVNFCSTSFSVTDSLQKICACFLHQRDGGTMTEAEILRLIRRVAGISQQADEQATQPDSVTAENYARVVAEVMRRDGIQLNDVDMRDIRIRVLEMLAYNRRVEMYREKEKITYHWKKPERLRR